MVCRIVSRAVKSQAAGRVVLVLVVVVAARLGWVGLMGFDGTQGELASLARCVSTWKF